MEDRQNQRNEKKNLLLVLNFHEMLTLVNFYTQLNAESTDHPVLVFSLQTMIWFICSNTDSFFSFYMPQDVFIVTFYLSSGS